jgi:Tripartite tricarboxylate transporter TctB family
VEKLKDRDVLSALVLLVIGTIALSNAGDDPRNWIFPRLATYVILAVAAVLLARVVIGAIIARAPDIIPWEPDDRIILVDLVIFGAIVLGYVFVMYGLGFWLASFLMLTLASLYLTQEKTRKNLILAVVVPLAACIVAYIVFLHIFYVPLPEARWWAGFR